MFIKEVIINADVILSICAQENCVLKLADLNIKKIDSGGLSFS